MYDPTADHKAVMTTILCSTIVILAFMFLVSQGCQREHQYRMKRLETFNGEKQ